MVFDPTPFIGRFSQEARELIQKLNDALMALEKSPGDRVKLQVLRKRALWGEEQLEFDFELGE